jgi:hypothetical protein
MISEQEGTTMVSGADTAMIQDLKSIKQTFNKSEIVDIFNKLITNNFITPENVEKHECSELGEHSQFSDNSEHSHNYEYLCNSDYSDYSEDSDNGSGRP